MGETTNLNWWVCRISKPSTVLVGFFYKRLEVPFGPESITSFRSTVAWVHGEIPAFFRNTGKISIRILPRKTLTNIPLKINGTGKMYLLNKHWGKGTGRHTWHPRKILQPPKNWMCSFVSFTNFKMYFRLRRTPVTFSGDKFAAISIVRGKNRSLFRGNMVTS